MPSSNSAPCSNCNSCVPWTNDPSHFNKVFCRICQAEIRTDLIKKHINRKHKSSYKDYLEGKGAAPLYVNKKYHKCKICRYIMLFNKDLLQAHSKSRHNLTLKQYITIYLN